MLATINSFTSACGADCRDALKVFADLLMPLILLIGFFLIVRQLGLARRQVEVAAQSVGLAQAEAATGQTWRRTEYTAKEAKAFLDNPETRRVLNMLDWTIRSIDTEATPGSVRPVTYAQERGFLTEAPDPDKHVVLIDALQPHEKKPGFTRLEALARDDVDRFLAGLERFERLIKTGLISWTDVEPYFRYWVDLLNGGKAHVSRPFLETLRQYMAYYQYNDALAFLNRGLAGAAAPAAAPEKH